MKNWEAGKRRELSWLFPTTGAVLAAFTIFLASVGWASWIVVPLSIAAAVVIAVIPHFQQRARAKDDQAQTRHRSMLTQGKERSAPLVSSITLTGWRVHESRIPSEYLRRSVENEFITVLQDSKAILVIGPSMVGKTRMASQIVTENYPNKHVLIPDSPDGMATIMNTGNLPVEHIIWLDDMERYLQDPAHLKSRWINELQEKRNILIATMRATAYEAFIPNGEDPTPTQWDTLQQFTRIAMHNDAEEKRRLANETSDPDVSRGILNHGLGTYLGGGVLAIERLEAGRSTNPLGRGLVLAAIDWHRSGIGNSVPQHLAMTLAPTYMDNPPSQITEEDKEKALMWATDTAANRGLFGLLELSQEGTLQPFDYLLDFISSTNPPIPALVWGAVTRSEASASQLNNAGLVASKAKEREGASILFQRAAEMGDPDAMVNYAISLDTADRTDEAYAWDSKAAAAGNPRGLTALAVKMLRSGGHVPTAERLLLQAAEAGETSAMANLGVLHLSRGEAEVGTNWYKRAAEAGSPLGMVNYAMRLELLGEEADAENWYKEALEAGDASGAAHFQLFMLAEKRGNADAAMPLLEEAVFRRNPSAMGKMGLIFLSEGRDGDAYELFQGAAERGGAVGLAMVGRALGKQGRYDEAESMLLRAASQNLTWARSDLGDLYMINGRIQEAKEQYLICINSGADYDDYALCKYGEILMQDNSLSEGERLFRTAANAGSSTGMYLFSQTLRAAGHDESASLLLEKAAILGHVDALFESGQKALAAGDLNKAIQRLRRAADAGHEGASQTLTALE
ncbi:hypothetical protein ACLRGH_01130 [Arthrobacter koreensis]|uniref:SEL1-like repeat protein n=1 Tax=Arthrobacter koreensis TaxID=199136 RepID=UPI003AC0F864